MLDAGISIGLGLVDGSEPTAKRLSSFGQCDEVKQEDIATRKLKYFEVKRNYLEKNYKMPYSVWYSTLYSFTILHNAFNSTFYQCQKSSKKAN